MTSTHIGAPSTSEPASKRARAANAELVVVVDPCSSGALLAFQLAQRGFKVARVWSDVVGEDIKLHAPKELKMEFVATIDHTTGAVEETVQAIRALDYTLRDVIVGCETGVLLADILSEALGCRTNGTQLSNLRRDKFEQTEAVRAHGLPAAHQKLCRNMSDVEAFLADYKPEPFKAVVKPNDGAGSDGVSICNSREEVIEAFERLHGATNALGLENGSVLLQEYLRGDEYVVDTVSRDGEHKCVAIWKYDKRVFYGAPVVYYGMRLMTLGTEGEPYLEGMVKYIFGVLDALGIKNGAVHSEIKVENDKPRGPVLIEANCRLHGGDGSWAPVSQKCLGYSQVSALIDAYMEPSKFGRLPIAPSAKLGYGAWLTVRSPVGGVLKSINDERLDKIRSLGSFISEYAAFPAVGATIVQSRDALTVYGALNLASTDEEQFEADYKEAQLLIDAGLFEVEC